MILPPYDFCLIRHGETEANRDGIIAGRTEAQLTEPGRDAARALAAQVWPRPVALFTSPQDRARETAALAFPAQSARVVEDLRERNWGIHEGRPLAELPPRTTTPIAGEAWEVLLARVAGALRQCLMAAGTALPVIVAHSGVIRAARALTGGDFTGASAPNTTPLLFSVTAGGWHEQPLFAARSDR
ncbi:histidine phosphatase family protein [Phaeovulum sp. W22_SRMD_FR3]|uniref:histidine phosphatase family protein n=1 Tax=Phaeovulum sp. W22_SRMD_FR3 TaxID=3240274 RepID=UPI003F99790A